MQKNKQPVKVVPYGYAVGYGGSALPLCLHFIMKDESHEIESYNTERQESQYRD
jgi:hypothetical protein